VDAGVDEPLRALRDLFAVQGTSPRSVGAQRSRTSSSDCAHQRLGLGDVEVVQFELPLAAISSVSAKPAW